MKGDYSRFSFDPTKHYRAVLMQQGRLQLDSDWNEQVQMMEHRYSAFFQSMLGRSGTPREMEMVLERPQKRSELDQLTLTKGIYYIDGMLIENDDFIVLDVPHDAKEELFYYLDVWTREVSAAEDSNLIDPALGLETTARLKTEWMVRYQVFSEIEKYREKYEKGDWPELESGNWWRGLSTGTLKLVSDPAKVDKSDNRVMLDNDDNRLYRIEVHQEDPSSSKYRFKWSADNASICAEVTTVDNKLFVLKNNTTDMQNSFKNATCVELFIPGVSGKSEGFWRVFELSDNSGNSFDSENGKLILKDPWEITAEKPKIIMRRWDGVSPEKNTKDSLALELGVDFVYDNTKFYRHGDYWLVQVRNGKIVNWKVGDIKEPEGVEHHFAALGIVTSNESTVEKLELLSVSFDPLGNPDIKISGDFEGRNGIFSGNLSVGGDASITGVLTAKSTANIVGLATIGSSITNAYTQSLTVNGQTKITGRAIIGTSDTNAETSRLEVYGGTTLSGNTNIIGTLFTQSSANIAGNTTIGSSITAADDRKLTVFGATTLGGEEILGSSRLTVHGGTTITEYTTIGTPLTQAEYSSKVLLLVYGGTLITGRTDIRGDTYIGRTDVNSNLLVSGAARITGNTTINGNLTVDGAIIVTDSPFPPVISGFFPFEAAYDSVLSIFGYNFSTTASNNVVKLNGVQATVVSVSATQLTVTVPKNKSCSGRITVTVRNQTATSPAAFTYVPTSVVSTLAGSGSAGFSNGQGNAARFNHPRGITVDSAGNLYVTDGYNRRICKVTPTGLVSTFSGSGSEGSADGTATSAQFTDPHGITIDKSGNLYVLDQYRIRKVTSTGSVTTFAELDNDMFPVALRGIAIDRRGNLYVTDINFPRIYKVTPFGEVIYFSGNGSTGISDGGADVAEFNSPCDIAIDASGNLYVVDACNKDASNNLIRKVTPSGFVSTLAGNGTAGFADGTGSAARFSSPCDITIDESGNLYVVDHYNDRIRKVTSTGVVSTLAGNESGNTNGVGTVAQFKRPSGITRDSSGNLYVADNRNHCIRKIVFE